MNDHINVAVIYYSATGTVGQLAGAVADGACEAGAQTRVRQVRETAPLEAIAANPAWAERHAVVADEPRATVEDLLWADAVVFGTPTRFGNISAQLKSFIDTLGGAWSRGELADKVYSGFTATSTAHGGQESTLLALYQSVHHFGGLVVAPGYTDASKFDDGNPYGTGHTESDGPVGEIARAAARHQGRRVASIAGRLRGAAVAARSTGGDVS